MIVLSIGAEPANETDVLSETLGVKLDDRTGFFLINEEDDISAIGNNRIFVIGNASGPKDSQYSLSQASAAAMKVLIALDG
jgi:heterodisulfide reductase subunit A-like polyferredoxin